jgi:hypothetical protein
MLDIEAANVRAHFQDDNGNSQSSADPESISSGLGPVSSLMMSGSSAMPQIGQLPAASCRICGCIGQV